jgi:hypothetical protein
LVRRQSGFYRLRVRQDLLVLRGRKVCKVYKARKETRGLRVCRVFKDRLGTMERKDFQGQMGLRGYKDQRDLRGFRGFRGFRGRRENLEPVGLTSRVDW